MNCNRIQFQLMEEGKFIGRVETILCIFPTLLRYKGKIDLLNKKM